MSNFQKSFPKSFLPSGNTIAWAIGFVQAKGKDMYNQDTHTLLSLITVVCAGCTAYKISHYVAEWFIRMAVKNKVEITTQFTIAVYCAVPYVVCCMVAAISNVLFYNITKYLGV